MSAHLDQKTILVIDDEPLVRQSMAVYLEDSGYNIIEAEHGEQGIGLFCEYQPDLVLCDLRMPVMDGMEVLRRVTNMSPQVPVIVVSGAGQIQDVVEALRLGALDYLVKPVADMSLLESAVENAFRHSEQHEKNLLVNDQVEQANAELKEHLDLLQQDQEAGRRAQLQLLPEPTADIGEYRFQHIIIPSMELSGDFIDYFQISPRYIGFYIADVSGQGAAAAFVTMTLKSLFNEPIRAFRQNKNDIIINPHSLLLYLNEELCNANLGKQVNLFYGVIDQDKAELIYANAGQYPAPILRNHGSVHLLTGDGFPLGLFEWATYNQQKLSTGGDFCLLMISDGYLELLDACDDKYSAEEMLLQSVQNANFSVQELMKLLQKNTQNSDDVTVFSVNRIN